MISGEYLNAEIDDITYQDFKTENHTSLSFKVTADALLNEQSNLYFLNYDPIKLFSYDWISPKERRYPIKFNYPRSVSKNISIDYGDRFKIEAQPEYLSLESYGIQYSSISRRDDNILNISKDLNMTESIYFKSVYDDLREIFLSIQKNDKGQVILRSI